MTKLLVGLEIQGINILKPKHNVGFMLIDQLAKKQMSPLHMTRYFKLT